MNHMQEQGLRNFNLMKYVSTEYIYTYTYTCVHRYIDGEWKDRWVDRWIDRKCKTYRGKTCFIFLTLRMR